MCTYISNLIRRCVKIKHKLVNLLDKGQKACSSKVNIFFAVVYFDKQTGDEKSKLCYLGILKIIV